MADGNVVIKLNVDTSDAVKSIDNIINKVEGLGKRGTGINEKLIDLKSAFNDIGTGKLVDIDKIGINIEKTMLRLKDAMISFGSSLDMTNPAAFQAKMQGFVDAYKQLDELKILTQMYKEQQDIMLEAHNNRVKNEAAQDEWLNAKNKQSRENYIAWWESTLAEQEASQKKFQEAMVYPTQAAKAGTPMSAADQVKYFSDLINAYKAGTAEYEQILNRKREVEKIAANESAESARQETERVKAARQEYVNWWNQALAEQDVRRSTVSVSSAEIDQVRAAINELNKLSASMPAGKMQETQEYTRKLSDALRVLSSAESSVIDKENALKTLRGELSDSNSKLSKTTADLTAQAKAQEQAAKKSQLLAMANEKLTLKTSMLGKAVRQVTGYLMMYLSVYRLVGTLKEAITASSDLIEVQNVVDTTFGESADAIDEFAKSAVYNLGMSELSAKNFVSSFGSTLKAAGINEGLSDLSMSLTQLVGDFASFRNLSFDDAFQKIQSAITGQTRGIRLYGVAVTDANLANYALELGITKSTKAMTENEKIMLRMSFMLRAMRDSAGDFVKTQDTWANQTRILSETWKQFLTILGDTLRITLTGALKWVISFVQNLVMVIKYIRAFFALLSDANTKFDEYGNIISGKWAAPDYSGFSDGIESDMNTIEESADDASEALQGLLASYDDVQVLSKSSSSSSSLDKNNSLTADDFNLNSLMGQQSLAASQWSADIEAPNFDITKVEKAVKWYNEHVKPIFEWISDHKEEIVDAILTIVAAFLTFKVIQTLFTVFSTVSTFFKGLISILSLTGPAGVVILVIGLIIAGLVLLYNTCDDFKVEVDESLGNVGERFETLGDTFDSSKQQMSTALDNLVKAFQNAGFDIENVWDLVGLAIEAVGIWMVVSIETTVETISSWISGLINVFGGFINIVVGLFKKDWAMVWEGAKEVVAGAVQIMTGWIDALIGAINKIFNLDLPKLGDTLSNWILGVEEKKNKSNKGIIGSVPGASNLVSKSSSGMIATVPGASKLVAEANKKEIEAANNIVNTVLGAKTLMNKSTSANANIVTGALASRSLSNSEQKTTNQLLTKLNTNMNNAMNKTITIELDGNVIGQSSIDYINGVTIRTGKSPIK